MSKFYFETSETANIRSVTSVTRLIIFELDTYDTVARKTRPKITDQITRIRYARTFLTVAYINRPFVVSAKYNRDDFQSFFGDPSFRSLEQRE